VKGFASLSTQEAVEENDSLKNKGNNPGQDMGDSRALFPFEEGNCEVEVYTGTSENIDLGKREKKEDQCQ